MPSGGHRGTPVSRALPPSWKADSQPGPGPAPPERAETTSPLARHPPLWDAAATAAVAAGTGLIDAPPAERLDLRNGLAGCPAHDVAFDTGLLTVNGGLRIHLASRLTNAVQGDPLARQYYGRPPLRQTLLLPPGSRAPARKYLDWHRTYVFAA
jgi:hypothetical protein